MLSLGCMHHLRRLVRYRHHTIDLGYGLLVLMCLLHRVLCGYLHASLNLGMLSSLELLAVSHVFSRSEFFLLPLC